MTHTINLSGQNYPINFGYAALCDFEELAGISVIKFLQSFSTDYKMRDVILLAWAGLKAGARVEKQPFQMEWQDVADLMDGTPGALTTVIELVSDSMIKSTGADVGNAKTPVKKTAIKKVS